MPDASSSSPPLWSLLLQRWKWLRDRIPLTWQGSVLFALSGFVLWVYGIQLEDWILLVVGLFGVLLVVLSSVAVGASAMYVRWRLNKLNEGKQHLPIYTDTNQPAVSGFLLPRFVPPFVDFVGKWVEPNARIEHVTLLPDRTERIFFSHRGRYQSIHRRFEVFDFFGLALVRWDMVEARDIEVWPGEHPHPPPFVRSFSDGDDVFVPNRPRRGDRVDIRQYLPGDSVRMIHWKLYARSHEAYVRVPESAASLEKQITAFLISDEEDEFAAQLVRFDLEHAHFGKQWRFGADHGDEVAMEIPVARRVLAMSGQRPPLYGTDLESFLQKANFKVEQDRLILYASGGLRRWLPVMEPILRKYCSVITLIIANQEAPSLQAWQAEAPEASGEVAASTQESGWRRWLFRPEASIVTKAEEEPWSVLRSLSQQGLQLQLLHPPQSQRMPGGKQGRPPASRSPAPRGKAGGVPPPSSPPPPRRARPSQPVR